MRPTVPAVRNNPGIHAAAVRVLDSVRALRSGVLYLGTLTRAMRMQPEALNKQAGEVDRLATNVERDASTAKLQARGQILTHINDITVVDRVLTYRKRLPVEVVVRHLSSLTPAEKAVQDPIWKKIHLPQWVKVKTTHRKCDPLVELSTYAAAPPKEVPQGDSCEVPLARCGPGGAVLFDWSCDGCDYGPTVRMFAAFGITQVYVSTEVPYRWLRYQSATQKRQHPRAGDCLVGREALHSSSGVVDAVELPMLLHNPDQPLPTARKLGFKVICIDAHNAYGDHPLAAPLNTIPRLAADEKAVFVIAGRKGFSAQVLRHATHIVTPPAGAATGCMAQEDYQHVVMQRLLPRELLAAGA